MSHIWTVSEMFYILIREKIPLFELQFTHVHPYATYCTIDRESFHLHSTNSNSATIDCRSARAALPHKSQRDFSTTFYDPDWNLISEEDVKMKVSAAKDE